MGKESVDLFCEGRALLPFFLNLMSERKRSEKEDAVRLFISASGRLHDLLVDHLGEPVDLLLPCGTNEADPLAPYLNFDNVVFSGAVHGGARAEEDRFAKRGQPLQGLGA